MKASSSSPDGGRVSLHAEGNLVTLRGEIDQASPRAFLGPFFETVHQAAEAEGLRQVKVDVQGLRFLNSSAVKELIAWVLKRNRKTPGYTLTSYADAQRSRVLSTREIADRRAALNAMSDAIGLGEAL